MSNLRTAVGSAGKWALCSGRDRFNHLRATLANLKSAEPAPAAATTAADDAGDIAEAEVKECLSEWGISSQLLRISALAVALKALHHYVDRQWLQTAISAGGVILEAPLGIWSMMPNLDFVPVICTLVMAAVTWCTVFLDRCIPGVSPPCPGSVKNHWFLTSSSFHLGHAIAVVNGFLITLLIYFRASESPLD